MTDQNGEVVATYEYDSWGNVLKSDRKGIAADNPFGYAGYMYDKEIGMYYLIARYYNPEHGVFLSVDPDPGDEDDPDGHAAWLVINAAIGGYSAYQAYKSGKSRKEILLAGAMGFVGGGKGKIAKKAVGFVNDRAVRGYTKQIFEKRRAITPSNINQQKRKFLGNNHVKISAGKWRSADGTRQFRAKKMYMLDIVQRKGKRNDNIRSANIYKRKLTRVY
ncbi:RHS repeat-associated core domain-containing protein [Bacillus cereus MC118]|uniref:RHS repeat-associated core domain-containing protein n=1 Tax=Bacillus cereus MC67 TaxID=1053219 RepID=J8FNM2_BACCE|nr:RHS repeat-associated core domain-containing protein [Bacillus cereus]EJR02710.1 RHS repeat-associated core domain-containing protein [Bacillus cereus MC67]EOP13419.1 RHS repeat-associated core domain-containing protein [Bacillus cereus MC118]